VEPRPLAFEKAQVLCYRVFDVAEEIDLERARKLVSEESRRLKLGREGSQYLELPNPPLAVDLGKRALALKGGAVTVEAHGGGPFGLTRVSLWRESLPVVRQTLVTAFGEQK